MTSRTVQSRLNHQYEIYTMSYMNTYEFVILNPGYNISSIIQYEKYLLRICNRYTIFNTLKAYKHSTSVVNMQGTKQGAMSPTCKVQGNVPASLMRRDNLGGKQQKQQQIEGQKEGETEAKTIACRGKNSCRKQRGNIAVKTAAIAV